MSDDEMGLHVWNESRELVCNTLGGNAIPVFPRYRNVQRFWRIRTFRNRVSGRGMICITDARKAWISTRRYRKIAFIENRCVKRLLGIRRKLFKKSDDGTSESMREMHEDEFEELMDAAHRAISEMMAYTYKGAPGSRIKTFIPETIDATRMMVQEWVNMHRAKCQGGPDNPFEFWRPRIRNNDSWISRELPPHAVIVGWANDNIRRRLNGDRERRHEDFLMNFEQI